MTLKQALVIIGLSSVLGLTLMGWVELSRRIRLEIKEAGTPEAQT